MIFGLTDKTDNKYLNMGFKKGDLDKVHCIIKVLDGESENNIKFILNYYLENKQTVDDFMINVLSSNCQNHEKHSKVYRYFYKLLHDKQFGDYINHNKLTDEEISFLTEYYNENKEKGNIPPARYGSIDLYLDDCIKHYMINKQYYDAGFNKKDVAIIGTFKQVTNDEKILNMLIDYLKNNKQQVYEWTDNVDCYNYQLTELIKKYFKSLSTEEKLNLIFDKIILKSEGLIK